MPRWPADQTYGAIEAFSGALSSRATRCFPPETGRYLSPPRRADRRASRPARSGKPRPVRPARWSSRRREHRHGPLSRARGRPGTTGHLHRARRRSPRVLYKLALAFPNGQAQDAIVPLRSAVAMTTVSRGANLLGMCLRDRGRTTRPAALTRAVEINPASSPRARSSSTYRARGRQQDALDHSRRWPRSSPRTANGSSASGSRSARGRTDARDPTLGRAAEPTRTSRRSIRRSAGCGWMRRSRGTTRRAGQGIEALAPIAEAATASSEALTL